MIARRLAAPGAPAGREQESASPDQASTGEGQASVGRDQPVKLDAEYVLPLRWDDDREVAELSGYLERLAHWLDVTVVDGSPPRVFAAHRARWSGLVRHVAPEDWPGRNRKVAGVITGIRLARHDRVVIADDDVRYEREGLARLVDALGEADAVRPQNYFAPRPWHARWDTGRSLVNRAFGSDYPGTLGVRRQLVLAAGGYDGDVLFENLELLRTVVAAGGTERRLDDLLVRRLPASVGHFIGQRVRQAYDDFGQPGRLMAELALLPALLWAIRRPRRLMLGALLAIAIGEYGRRRGSGATVFPATSALWVPVWLGERAVCVWLAVLARIRGGARYRDARILRAATPAVELRQRLMHVRATREMDGDDAQG